MSKTWLERCGVRVLRACSGDGPGELALRETAVGEWGKPASPSTWGHPEPHRRWGPSGPWPGARPHHQESELGRCASEARPAWGGPGLHGAGCLPLASPASGACAEAWGLPHTVRVWTQTQARASRISATKSHVGVRAHEGRCSPTPPPPGALFWSWLLSTDPMTLRFALNDPLVPLATSAGGWGRGWAREQLQPRLGNRPHCRW